MCKIQMCCCSLNSFFEKSTNKRKSIFIKTFIFIDIFTNISFQNIKNMEQDNERRVLEEKATEELLEAERNQKMTKPCPFCGCDNIKPTGCEYVTCSFADTPARRLLIENGVVDNYNKMIKENKDGMMTGKNINDFAEEIKLTQKMLIENMFVCPGGFNSKCEWCWLCDKPKYQVDPMHPDKGFCIDKNHNSH